MTQINSGIRAFAANAALGSYLRVLEKSDGSVDLAGPSDEVIGLTDGPAFAAGDNVSVRLKNVSGTRKVTCASTCSIGDRLYGTTAGKVDTITSTGLGTAGGAIGKAEFIALEACLTAGGLVESLPLERGGLGGLLFSAQGDSAAAGTSSVAESFFPTNLYSIPANTLKAGDVIKIKARAVVTAQNGTDTAQIQLYLGTVKVVDCAARDLDVNEEVPIDATIVVTDIGAVGHVKGWGSFAAGDLISSVALSQFSLASTALDTTAAAIVRASVTFSGSSAGNAAKLRDLIVELIRQ